MNNLQKAFYHRQPVFDKVSRSDIAKVGLFPSDRKSPASRGAAATWPLAAHTQQPGRMRRISVLMGLTESDPEGPPRVAIFKQGLQNLGWTEGRNLQIEYRWAGGDANRTRTLAAELAGTMPDVVVAHLTVGTGALMQETRTT
jgi:putative ABC transport system substrate-binding protein